MRVGVLGATGMVGSQMVRVLRDAGHHVWPTRTVETLSDELDAVINCAGSVPERGDSPADMIRANAVLPHQAAEHCERIGARLIHISTDCVFGGRTNVLYREDDTPDAESLYGRSKALGEPPAPHLTLRTSVIGHGGRHGLVNWLMAQRGDVDGWENAIFSGLTNIELARVVRGHVLPNAGLSGVYHLASDVTSKYLLLMHIAAAYNLPVRVRPVANPRIDRSLSGARFAEATGYEAPSWHDMIEEMRRAYLAR